jgi:uncharacterized protein YggE
MLQNAHATAQLLAEEADVELGRVLRISDGDVGGPRPMEFQAARVSAAAERVPIASGQQTLRAVVNISYEINSSK